MAPLSQLDLKNVGKPQVPGITNKNVLPPNLSTSSGSLGVKAKAPTTNVSKPTTTLPAAQVQKPVQSPDANALNNLEKTALSIKAKVNELPKEKPPKAPPPPPPTPTYGGIIGDLIRKANEGSTGVQKATQALTKFQGATADKVADIRSQAIPLEFQQGRAQVVQQASAEKEKALQTGVANALASQQQELSALNNAGSLAAPQLAQYGQTFYNPLNPGAGGDSALNPVAAIPNYASQVAGGQMSYDQAVSALGGNSAFVASLNDQIRRINPSFSPVQSNANAAVQGQTLAQTAQQSNALQLASQNAYKALNLLSSSYNNLGGLQKTPVPLINKLTGAISSNSGIGAADTQAYNTAIQEARAAVSQVLSAVGNTPTYSESTAAAIIPDYAGPEQIAAAIKTVEQLIAQKTSSYSQPGIAPQFGQTSGGIFDW